MQVLKNGFGILSVGFLLTACSNVDFKKTKAGVPYKIISSGKGEVISQNSIVRFNVLSKTKDTVLYSSYESRKSEFERMEPSMEAPNYSNIRMNIVEILGKTRKGDSVYIVQEADSLVKQIPQLATQLKLKKGDQIITTIKILDVYKSIDEAQAVANKERLANYDKTEGLMLEKFKGNKVIQDQMAKDGKIIEDYMAAHKVQATKTLWGTYVQVLNPGQGARPVPGQFVSVKYSGSNMQGQVFDAGTFPLQLGMSNAIKGFEEGVKQLAKGGKAKVFVPSTLAYGPGGQAPKIKPDENLIFDIEILDISDKQPSPQPVDTTKPRK